METLAELILKLGEKKGIEAYKAQDPRNFKYFEEHPQAAAAWVREILATIEEHGCV